MSTKKPLEGLTLQEQVSVINIANGLLALAVMERLGDIARHQMAAERPVDDKPKWVRGARVSPKKV